jgi:hypothetical protein
MPVQINSNDKPSIDMRIEREGLLEMRNINKKDFNKKRFTVTPEVLIYHSPEQKGTYINNFYFQNNFVSPFLAIFINSF